MVSKGLTKCVCGGFAAAWQAMTAALVSDLTRIRDIKLNKRVLWRSLNRAGITVRKTWSTEG
jgi:hypothetical protein